MHVCAGGVVDDAARGNAEQGAKVAGGDRLVDHERVVAGWRCNLHPVVEDTWVLLADHPVFHAVLHTAQGLGGTAGEGRTSRPRLSDLTHLCWNWRRRWRW